MVFGGFVRGTRVSEVYTASYEPGQKAQSHKPHAVSGSAFPEARASHSAVAHNGKLYVFGGLDEYNEKLNDLWEFSAGQWKKIETAEGDYVPVCRSGHAAAVGAGKMFIFGGILEVTQELNDLVKFDFATSKFTLIEPIGKGLDETGMDLD
jgi:N-acetylneuraminic acid mutarotase